MKCRVITKNSIFGFTEFMSYLSFRQSNSFDVYLDYEKYTMIKIINRNNQVSMIRNSKRTSLFNRMIDQITIRDLSWKTLTNIMINENH